MFELLKLREDVLDNIFENLDKISNHKECEAIINFMFPDLYAFDFYDEVVSELVECKLADYIDDLYNPKINENNYETIYESIYLQIIDNIHVSDFTINGKSLIWRNT